MKKINIYYLSQFNSKIILHFYNITAMKKIKLLFGLCLLSFSATAQIVTEESPISTRPEVKQWLAARSLSFERMENQPIDLLKSLWS
jgi:hypothetical protein